MKTIVVNEKSIARKWYLVDANNVSLGRLASTVANLLIGKRKVAYSPNQDHGDYVIVINSDKIKLTGKKPLTKTYFSHSHRPGHAKNRPYLNQMRKDSTKVIRHAVHGMIQKNPLGSATLKKLHVYADDKHPHEGQKPEIFSLIK